MEKCQWHVLLLLWRSLFVPLPAKVKASQRGGQRPHEVIPEFLFAQKIRACLKVDTPGKKSFRRKVLRQGRQRSDVTVYIKHLHLSHHASPGLGPSPVEIWTADVQSTAAWARITQQRRRSDMQRRPGTAVLSRMDGNWKRAAPAGWPLKSLAPKSSSRLHSSLFLDGGGYFTDVDTTRKLRRLSELNYRSTTQTVSLVLFPWAYANCEDYCEQLEDHKCQNIFNSSSPSAHLTFSALFRETGVTHIAVRWYQKAKNRKLCNWTELQRGMTAPPAPPTPQSQ